MLPTHSPSIEQAGTNHGVAIVTNLETVRRSQPAPPPHAAGPLSTIRPSCPSTALVAAQRLEVGLAISRNSTLQRHAPAGWSVWLHESVSPKSRRARDTWSSG
ncbi:uncharacterized protein B0I36DRAFT_126439 [Microdochium trichocladiopsis]|uniref:Uncharacterized protein n=1 Tax=Microdochium trichocladiopsis TaxID=1682393 RepID=A0A9P8Y3B8_9PEZI|nr:uncharacterized protein B0I36DRAFT_126439 [Microdochium trichocladiopsis]KAH7028832.1 hypothetical protein B0I36DRAFT_126439 [Microdochium trichocladiopsis]